MQRSKIEISVHLVWATHNREYFLESPEIERAIHRCIEAETRKLKCVVLALNGMPDHVHLVVNLHSTVAISKLAQAVKGVSSQFANDELGFEGAFDWQDNYAAFSVSRSHLRKVIKYVENQKQHHADNDLWPEWEEISEQPDSPIMQH